MELKWLEDFLTLAEKGSFSRAAESRYVTQSAFSRRIRALEAWLGVELIDRSTYPTRLTRAGQQFREHAASVLASMHDIRVNLQGAKMPSHESLHIAVPHTLSLTFFPQWWTGIQDALGHVPCKLTAGNVHDAVMAMVEGDADLLLCYHHPQQPVKLDAGVYQMISLGEERLLPYTKPDKTGQPMFKLPGESGHPVPYLAYSPNAYFARMVDLLLLSAPSSYFMDKRYETDMAEALKAMAITGLGIAWLPDSAVKREIADGKLVQAGGAEWGEQMQILLYRRKGATKSTVETLWQLVSAKRGTLRAA